MRQLEAALFCQSVRQRKEERVRQIEVCNVTCYVIVYGSAVDFVDFATGQRTERQTEEQTGSWTDSCLLHWLPQNINKHFVYLLSIDNDQIQRTISLLLPLRAEQRELEGILSACCFSVCGMQLLQPCKPTKCSNLCNSNANNLLFLASCLSNPLQGNMCKRGDWVSEWSPPLECCFQHCKS